MSVNQKFPIVPPLEQDRMSLRDYSEIIQRNLSDLYNISHFHNVLEKEPKISDVEVGIPFVVKLNDNYYLYIKINASTMVRTNLTVVV